MKNFILKSLAYLSTAIIIVFSFALAIGLTQWFIKAALVASIVYIVVFVFANDKDTSIIKLLRGDYENE